MKQLKEKWRSVEALVTAFFLLRLFGIMAPPLETWHSWRQTLTLMIARNMPEQHFSLLFPMVDMGGERSGIIGSEFPLFQLIIAGFSTIFGEADWYGRLINLIICSLSVIVFFRLCSRWWNERTAWFATIVFLTSLWFAFSRKSMPDTFAVALVIIGIGAFQRFIDSRNTWNLLAGTLLIMLGGLCKIPAVFLFGLIVPLWLSRNIRINTKWLITAAVGLASGVILWWYFYWVPHLVHTYGFQLYFPKGLLEGWKEIRPLFADFSAQIYFGALRSYTALIPLLLGILWLFYRPNRKYLAGFAVLTSIFLVFALKTGAVFPTHNYYILPLVPVMAALAGIGLQRIDQRFAIGLVILIAAEGIGNQLSDFRIKEEVRYKLTLEEQVDQLVPKGQSIIVDAGPDPQWMYWYHRKGWSLFPEEISDTSHMRSITRQGGKYIVIDKNVRNPELPYSLIGETRDIRVWKLP